MIKLYPSSAAFMAGELVYTEKKNGCLRKILCDFNGIREAFIPKSSVDLGAAFEARYETLLTQEGGEFEREISFKDPVEGFEEVVVSGRIDFLLKTDTGPIIIECKATQSSGIGQKIKAGQPVIDHLAQVVTYMISYGHDYAALYYGYYGKKGLLYERTFGIRVDDQGRISVDYTPLAFSVDNLLKHQYAQVAIAQNPHISNRPNNWDAKFNSPCGYCPFRSTCDKWDTGQIDSLDGFLTSARSNV